MAKRKTIKRGETPVYPTDEEARSLAYTQMQEVTGGEDPRTFFSSLKYDLRIDEKATWGVNNIYFVYAYPPAGFEIAEPEEVLALKTFEGWIFQYVPQTNKFNLLVKASRDGVAFFWQEHKRYTSK